MGIGAWWHWLIVLVVVVLIFGTKKLRNIGGDVGGAVKSFKGAMSEGMSGSDAATSSQETITHRHKGAGLIEAEVIEVPTTKVAPKKKAAVAKKPTVTKALATKPKTAAPKTAAAKAKAAATKKSSPQ